MLHARIIIKPKGGGSSSQVREGRIREKQATILHVLLLIMSFCWLLPFGGVLWLVHRLKGETRGKKELVLPRDEGLA